MKEIVTIERIASYDVVFIKDSDTFCEWIEAFVRLENPSTKDYGWETGRIKENIIKIDTYHTDNTGMNIEQRMNHAREQIIEIIKQYLFEKETNRGKNNG